jgi:DNA replication protein DnaC
MNVEVVREQMKRLKLKTASEELDDLLSKKKKAVDLGWVSEILQIEIDARKQSTINRRIKKANFPELASLEQFNWDFNPKIPRAKIEELAEFDFINKNQIALFVGNPGTGKSHIAIALGIKAAQAGHSVFCTSVKKLSKKIKIAIAHNTLDALFKQMLNAKLWVLDDWGVVSMSRDVSEEVFDLLDRRKHSSAMILTSNRDVEEWPQVFSDPVLANAAIDRMFENANVCIFEGESYRMRGRITFKEIDLQKDNE